MTVLTYMSQYLRPRFNVYLGHDYWVDDDEKIEMMEGIEYLCANFQCEELTELNEKLTTMDITEQPVHVSKEVRRIKRNIIIP